MNAMNTTPFSLRIFVADGDPDGLRIVDKSNWIGKALVWGDIDKLLLSKLPEVLSADQKSSKVHNLLTSLSGKRIQNVGTRRASKWVLMPSQKQ